MGPVDLDPVMFLLRIKSSIDELVSNKSEVSSSFSDMCCLSGGIRSCTTLFDRHFPTIEVMVTPPSLILGSVMVHLYCHLGWM